MKNLKTEITSFRNFIKSHKDVRSVKVTKNDKSIMLDISKNPGDHIEWNFIQSAFTDYFKRHHNTQIVFDFGDDDDEIEIISKPKATSKDLVQPIAIYSTDKNDWRLFRFYSQSGGSDSSYYAPCEKIAEKELSNLANTFAYAVQDQNEKKFVRNIIELNINCLNYNTLKGKYISALRELPNNLKNRFAISLVRIAPDLSIHVLKQAALICKVCTDNIFMSFSYQNALEKDTLDQVYGISGYIITVPEKESETFDDIKKIYEYMNLMFKNKRSFLIYADNKDHDSSYKSKNIITLRKREDITVPV